MQQKALPGTALGYIPLVPPVNTPEELARAERYIRREAKYPEIIMEILGMVTEEEKEEVSVAEHCRNGHLRTKENTRIKQGKRVTRQCRVCENAAKNKRMEQYRKENPSARKRATQRATENDLRRNMLLGMASRSLGLQWRQYTAQYGHSAAIAEKVLESRDNPEALEALKKPVMTPPGT